MWRNTKWPVAEGTAVWVRGCRDTFVDGVVLTVSGSRAQVRTGPTVHFYNVSDIVPREETKHE